MESLAKALDDKRREDTFGPPSTNTVMLAAAREWAHHALGTYVGVRLRKALAISRAIAEFDAEDRP